MPFKQHCCHRRNKAIIATTKHAATPRRTLIGITRSHIKINACNITLKFVHRLKSHIIAAPTQCVRITAYGRTMITYLAIRQVAAKIIHTRIGRQYMIQIAFHRTCFTKPTLRNRMFFIPTITHLFLTAVGVVERKFTCGINIPYSIRIINTRINRRIVFFQIIVRYNCMTVNHTG